MLVSMKELPRVIEKLLKEDVLSLDTETTGLNPYKGDRLFSIIISSETEDYYFNFQHYEGLGSSYILKRKEVYKYFAELFSKENITWALHNAKFDMHILYQEGYLLAGEIHDTMVAARLIENNHFDYTLDAVAKRLGFEKLKTVEDYITANKLYTEVSYEGKKKKERLLHYDRVPLKLMQEYGEKDGRITYDVARWQMAKIEEIHRSFPKRPRIDTFKELYEREKKLVKVCFDMERNGVLIDTEYCEKALEYHLDLAEQGKAEFLARTGTEFVDSAACLAPAFDALGEKYPKTKTGRPSFTEAVLDSFTSPLAEVVKTIRKNQKLANTYYRNFLTMKDADNFIHPNMKQAGTETGRFSYSTPNFQNVPREAEEGNPFFARRAIIPPKDYIVVAIDYKTMEYMLMLEYSNDKGVIDKIKKGLDVHTATGEMFGVARSPAKTLNFLILYGGGNAKLASALGISLMQAKFLRNKYFRALPGVKRFTNSVRNKAKQYKHTVNIGGYINRYPKPDFTFPSPNHIIQGGCAQIVRKAMLNCYATLRGKKSKMILQCHDELLFYVHITELSVIPPLVKAMEDAYNPIHLKMIAEPSYSYKSWGDKIDGIPKELNNV